MAIALKRVDRPRELKWYQAGAMLYGDWGTSKAYVLGIAFALAGHASWFFLGLMSLLTTLVGICYMIICRCYPDGGGVYSSVKRKSQTLAVIGAFLLVADYSVTAALSAFEAFHYFGFSRPVEWAILSIVVIGIINWIGPTKGGSLALIIGLAASVVAGILFISTVPHLVKLELTWPKGNFYSSWSTFVGIVLALSGVEAVANMTGVMKQPVERTSKLAILPVLFEVSLLTFLLGFAMNAVPGLGNHTEDMLKALGTHYIGPWYGQLISVVFGFLLLSAANTAVGALVGIQFSMARDRELPQIFSKLNRWGMPSLALMIAVLIPIAILMVEQDLVHLASLYAIGVVGAITLNLGATALNKELQLKKWERNLLLFSAIVLLLIEVTIAVEKQNALIFALIILGSGLILRSMSRAIVPAPISQEVASINVLTVAEAKEIEALYKSSSMIAFKSINPFLLEEATMRVKSKGENSIYLVYVEESPPSRELPTELEPSEKSLELLGQAQKEMEARGITAVPVWRLGDDPGKLIADAARELDVKTVMIGTTKRSALTNLLRGDVFRTLARNLPNDCHLVISG